MLRISPEKGAWAALAATALTVTACWYKAPSFARILSDPISDLQKALPHEKVVIDQHSIARFLHPPGTSHQDLSVSPIAVVEPGSTADVQIIVKIARKYGLSVISVSAQSSLEGHTLSIHPNTIIISFKNMSSIVALHPDDADAVVQPGLSWVDLNQHLKERGIPLFFPVDPSLSAQFGGMIGSGGSGTGAVKYGSIGSHVVNCTVVLADGSVLTTRSRSRKSAMGWDATKLFVGAEGTLGVITEATVRLSPVTSTQVAIATFASVHDAVAAVVKLQQSSVQVHCIELLDDLAMRAVNLSRAEKLSTVKSETLKKYLDALPESPSLWFKFSGGPGALLDAVNGTKETVKEFGGEWIVQSEDSHDAELIWNDRKEIFFSQQKLVPGCQVYITDNCVPISHMPELVRRTRSALDQGGFIAPLISHAGDGNLHAALLVSPDQSMAEAIKVAKKISHIAIELEGTASGEHGVGLSKKKFLEEELGANTVELMRNVKKILDPGNMLNPGKMLPS